MILEESMADYNLFLDDVRTPESAHLYTYNDIFIHWDWVVVKNYDEFVEYIEANGLPKFVSFDHDLADIHYDPATQRESFEYHETTGVDCAKWLIQYCIDNGLNFPLWYVHSANPIGMNNIEVCINTFLNARS